MQGLAYARLLRLTSLVALCLYFLCTAAWGQVVQLSGSGSCLDGVQIPSLLQVEDQITPFGPKLEDAQLIALENGRKVPEGYLAAEVLWDGTYKESDITHTIMY